MRAGAAVVLVSLALAACGRIDDNRTVPGAPASPAGSAADVSAPAPAKAARYIDATAAALPPEVVEKLTKKRKADDADAALDPLTDPEVRAAIQRASFELLIGFQLTEDHLRYNVTRYTGARAGAPGPLFLFRGMG